MVISRTQQTDDVNSEMFPMETSSVTPYNSRVLMVKVGHETSLVPNSTDKCRKGSRLMHSCKWPANA